MTKKHFITAIILGIALTATTNIYAETLTTPDEDDIQIETQEPAQPETTSSENTDDIIVERTQEETSSASGPEQNADNDIIIEQAPAPALYTISFNTDGGNEIRPVQKTSGTSLSGLPTPERTGYKFMGWIMPNGTKTNDNTVVSSDMTLTASWEPDGTTPYTVIRMTESLTGGYKEYDRQTFTGNADASVTVTPDAIEGFTAPKKQTITLSTDGKASVTFRYTRNSYKLHLTTGEGVTSKQKKFTYKYQEPVVLNVITNKDYTDISITGDASSKHFNMPAYNVAVSVSASPAVYKILYHGFGLDTSDLPVSYSLSTLPVKLKPPKETSVFLKFNRWLYDGLPISVIDTTDHTDIVLVADITPVWKYIIPALSVLGFGIMILCISIRNMIRHKHIKKSSDNSDIPQREITEPCLRDNI